MAPSRGPTVSETSTDEIAVKQQSNSALVTARRNFKFLVDPSSSDKPARLRTRAFLRFIRSAGQFLLWRLVRWAKYAAIGAIVTAIGATAFGSVVSGAAWVLAPPSIGASILAATVWGTGKFFARRLHRRWRETGGDVGEEQRERLDDTSTAETRAGRGLGPERGPQAVPW